MILRIHVSNLVGKFAFRKEGEPQLYRATSIACRPDGWVDIKGVPINITIDDLWDEAKARVAIVEELKEETVRWWIERRTSLIDDSETPKPKVGDLVDINESLYFIQEVQDDEEMGWFVSVIAAGIKYDDMKPAAQEKIFNAIWVDEDEL